jgi:hypothetical protein
LEHHIRTVWFKSQCFAICWAKCQHLQKTVSNHLLDHFLKVLYKNV